MSERWFKCGACGTEARGFRSDMMLAGFQDDHATICPGFPPATEAALQRPTPEVFSCPECGAPLELGHDCLAGCPPPESSRSNA